MPALSATEARNGFFEILRSTAEKHEVYHIHSKKGDVVMLSEEEYESLQETLQLLSIPGFKESLFKSIQQINKGETKSFEEVFGESL